MFLAGIRICYLFNVFLSTVSKAGSTVISFCGVVIKQSKCTPGVLGLSLGFFSLLNETLN